MIESRVVLYIYFATLLVLIHVIISYQINDQFVLSLSPIVDHQQVNLDGTWEQISLPRQTEGDIPDGRKIYFKTANNYSQCVDHKFFRNFGDLTSVSYMSNGKVLNATFWLSKPALGNMALQKLSNPLMVHQASIRIDEVIVSNVRNLSELYHKELDYLKREFANMTVLNQTIGKTNLDYYPANTIIFSGNLKFSKSENPEIKGKDVFSYIDGKLFRILYVTQADDFSHYLSIMDNMTKSLRFTDVENDSTVDNESMSNRSSNSKSVFDIQSNFTPSQYSWYYSKNFSITYPKEWKFTEDNNHIIRFFSPIPGPYLIGSGYTVAIDVPSVYDSPQDFMSKVIWWGPFSQYWHSSLEETSSYGHKRYIDLELNHSNFVKDQKNYEGFVPFSIELDKINYPKSYLLVFINQLNYVKNGLLCELIQKTNLASSPPVKLVILPSTNSTAIGPGQIKTIEINIKSEAEVPLNIDLSEVTDLKYMQYSFDPSILEIPPAGTATSQLTIKSNWGGIWEPSITQTLPVIAKVGINETEKSFALNTYFFNVSSSPLPKPTEMNIAITVFNLYDWIINTLNTLTSPVNFLIVVMTAIGTAIAWTLKRRKEKGYV